MPSDIALTRGPNISTNGADVAIEPHDLGAFAGE